MALNITVEEFTELRTYLHSQLAVRGQDIPMGDLATRMLHFSDKFDISAMIRFKSWMLENGYGHDEILVAIVHDLNDCDEVCFLPRTDSY